MVEERNGGENLGKIGGEVEMRQEVPIWKKSTLTLEEAAAYTGIGVNKLRDLSSAERCELALWNGSKRTFNAWPFGHYLV